MGLREVKKYLGLEKLKLVVFSPNMEKVSAKGGLDEILDELIGLAREKNIPFVFALTRRELGNAINKAVPVSCVGVFSYQSAEVIPTLLKIPLHLLQNINVSGVLQTLDGTD